jgi:hypothetical protein
LINKGNVTEALTLLHDGASIMLKANRWTEGTELANMFIDLLNQHQQPQTQENVGMYCRMKRETCLREV